MDKIIEEINNWANKEIEHEEQEVCSKCFTKIFTSKSKELGLCFRCRTKLNLAPEHLSSGWEYPTQDYQIEGHYSSQI